LSMEKPSAAVIGLGSYLPERVLTNQELEARPELDTSDEWIVQRTGIRERRIIADDEATSHMAIRSARACLEDAGVNASDVSLIIVATVTADMTFPATACLVQEAIGAEGAGAFDLVQGCTGFVSALATGAQFVENGAYKYVLVIGAEALTRATDWTDRGTCVLFGDGAGAVLLGPGEPGAGLLSFSMVNHGEHADLLKRPAGGSAQRVTPEAYANYDDAIRMVGRDIYRLAVAGIPRVAERALEKAGMSAADIDLLVMHQANVRIIESAAERLGFPQERVAVTVDIHGNTSGASMPLALAEMRAQGRLKKGDNVLMVGFGSGFALAAAVVKW